MKPTGYEKGRLRKSFFIVVDKRGRFGFVAEYNPNCLTKKNVRVIAFTYYCSAGADYSN